MHGGHANFGGGDFGTTTYFLTIAIISVLTAYYAMKFAMSKREAREKAEKALKRRLQQKKG